MRTPPLPATLLKLEQKLAMLLKGTPSQLGISNLTKAGNTRTLVEMNLSLVKARNFTKKNLFLKYKSTNLLNICSFTKIEIFRKYFSIILP